MNDDTGHLRNRIFFLHQMERDTMKKKEGRKAGREGGKK